MRSIKPKVDILNLATGGCCAWNYCYNTWPFASYITYYFNELFIDGYKTYIIAVILLHDIVIHQRLHILADSRRHIEILAYLHMRIELPVSSRKQAAVHGF